MKTDTQREDSFWLNLFGLTSTPLSAAHFVGAAGESGTTPRQIPGMTTKVISRIVNQSRCQPKSQSCRVQRQKDSLSYPLTRSMGKGSPLLPVG